MEKPKKEKLLLLIPENTGDRKLSVYKTIKYLLNIEKRYKVFQELNISNVPILHIPFDEYNNFRHFHLAIIAELFRGRSLLRNSTLITSHLTVV